MKKLMSTDSSNIRSVSYDSGVDGEYIDVEFSSGVSYRYTGVTQRMFVEACVAATSASLGKWVNEHLVKRKSDDDHQCTKLGLNADAPVDHTTMLALIHQSLAPPVGDVAREGMRAMIADALAGRLPPPWPPGIPTPIEERGTGTYTWRAVGLERLTSDQLTAIGYGLIRLGRLQ